MPHSAGVLTLGEKPQSTNITIKAHWSCISYMNLAARVPKYHKIPK